MQRWAVEFATTLKKMAKKESQYYEGFIIGRVISPPPSIRIAIDEAIILDDSHLIVAASANMYEREVEYIQTINTSTGKLKFIDTLKIGDEVILIPAGGNAQMYALLDRVEL